MMNRDRICEYLESLSVPDSGAKSLLLERYVSEIMLFNPALKLVGTNDRDEVVLRHIMDSVSGYPVFLRETAEKARIADLGSGAGLPGIVLAILFPDREFVLIERMHRRVGFLRSVSALLQLGNVTVIDRDIKEIGEKFDALTCRAFHPVYDVIDDMLSLSSHMILYKGTGNSIKTELDTLHRMGYSYIEERVPVSVPGLGEERNMVILKELRKNEER